MKYPLSNYYEFTIWSAVTKMLKVGGVIISIWVKQKKVQATTVCKYMFTKVSNSFYKQ